jgi:hypothetical protein
MARYQILASTEVPPERATPVLHECDFTSTAFTARHLLLFPFGHARIKDEANQNERYV